MMARRLRIGEVILFIAALASVSIYAACACAGEIVSGGDFETGNFMGQWVHGAGNFTGGSNPAWADHAVVLDMPYGGNYSALLGFKYARQRRNRFGFMYQDVTIPADVSSARLYFRFRQQGYDGNDYDPFRVEVRDLSDNTVATVVVHSFSEWNNQFKDSGWIEDDGVGPAGYDMTPFAGMTVRIYFRQENTYDNLFQTWTFVDDVSLIYRKYVDLIVDGQGDDLFGSPGTGAGGSSTRSGEAGETITYLLDIENEGQDNDSYILIVSPPPGWTAVIRSGETDYTFPWTSPVIPAGSTIQAEVRLTIPPSETVGGYTTILDAVSTSQGNRFDSVTLGTNVVPAQHLTDLAIDANGFGVIDPSGGGGVSYREVSPDTAVAYAIELLNAGVQADSFLIHFTGDPPLTAVMEEGATVHTGAFTTGTIDAGSSASYTLRVTVPASLLGGDYETLVFAHSLTDTLKKDGVKAVTRVRSAKVDMIIGGSGDGIVDPTGSGLGGSSTVAGTRGITVYFPIILQNEGAVVDSFTLDWTRPGGGWSAVINDGVTDHPFPWTTPAFEPFSQRTYTLAVRIPGGASYRTYVSLLDAVSNAEGTVRESVSASVMVCSGNEIDLLIDGNGQDMYGPIGTGLGGSSLQPANPGDTLFYTVTVENERGQNLFDLQWNTPAGWEVVIGDSSSTMRGIPAGVYTLEVRIPADSPGGTFDIIVDGLKTNRRFFVDSVRGRVIVLPPRNVDALVDGNGDGLFGTPGTGAGGFSSQSTIGGRIVRFTLELQNEGGEPESYTVSWNSFVGWAATLNGSNTPYTTSSIAGGASGLYTFEAVAPTSAAEGDYDYIIDVVSTADPTNVESVTARVHINPPPEVDLVIDGNGAFDTAPAGTGEGGRALLFGDPGTMIIATLEVLNRGGFPDSFQISWNEPEDWPAGSVLLSDASGDHTSPFVTAIIDPGSSLTFTVKVFIPAGTDSRSLFIMDGVGLSRDLEDSITIEVATTSFILARVFNDRGHDGLYDPGEEGWPGVTVWVTDPGGVLTALTGGDGTCLFEVPSGLDRDVIELTPAGMISLGPDTIPTGVTVTGDTVTVDFADVMGPTLAPNGDQSAPTGGFVDFPHTITAGTPGTVILAAALPPGWVEVFYRDNNANGVLDSLDTPLTSTDLDLDPDVPGKDQVQIIMRIFIPPAVPAGTVEVITLTLEQVLGGTSIAVRVSVTDRVLVMASASGMLRLVKQVDLSVAHPGDVMTYTIVFSNPGIEGVQEIEVIDPVSDAVDIVTDAFGPGQDIAWVRNGSTVYLTADPTDPDEALYETAERHIRFILSRQVPFILESGEEGRLIYMVRIK